MRTAVCPNCNENVQVPDDLADAHCVRCGQLLTAPDTRMTASPVPHLSRAIQPEVQGEYVPSPPSNKSEEARGSYSSWDDFRSNSPAVQRELLRLASRAMPDLRSMNPAPLPEDAPAEIDGWGESSGTMEVSADYRLHWQIFGWCLIIIGSFLIVGAGIELVSALLDARRLNQDDAISTGFMLMCYSAASGGLGVYCAFFRGSRPPTMLWIFEEGVFLKCYDRSLLSRWEDIDDFADVTDGGRPAYWLTLEHNFSVKISIGNSPQMIPLMEYIEIRLCAGQFLNRLKVIWNGGREDFGIVTLDRQGFEGRRFFAPWGEIRRVVSDSHQVFVDWSKREEWIPIPHQDVSFPYLVIALASVLIDEHARFTPVEA